ncbi:M23 family metallopeptidase [bacterium]|nr:M23 family metallopeptidase [bacterium]
MSFLTALAPILVSAVAGAVPVSVSLSDSLVPQGGIFCLEVRGSGQTDTVAVSFDGAPAPVVREGDRCYALLGVDMEARPGRRPVQVRLGQGPEAKTVRRWVRVVDGKFPVQRVTLPPEKVFPDTAAQARIKREDAYRDSCWSRWENRRYWSDRFIAPIDGQMNRFGNRRILNGAPRSPHTGVDITAESGTPVKATAAGRVIATGDFFFSGNSVYIDHGFGLISMYFHLSRVDVAQGDTVGQGQVIGAVGATGRVNGAHLHWGIRYRNARINPKSLLDLRLE